MPDTSIVEASPIYDPLIDLVISNGIIDQQQVEQLREEQANSGYTMRHLLISNGFVDEDDLLGMMAAYQGCDVVDLGDVIFDDELISNVPGNVARMYNVLPVAATAGSVTLATSNLIDPTVMDELNFVLTKDVIFAMVREKELSEIVL